VSLVPEPDPYGLQGSTEDFGLYLILKSFKNSSMPAHSSLTRKLSPPRTQA
jgi:hypothetical protein